MRSRTNDRGAVTTLFAVLLVFLMLIIAVLGEAGRKLNNLSQAEDLASEAARAAAATLDVNLIADGVARIDVVGETNTGRALMQAELVVATVMSASIESFEIVDDDRVRVRVRVRGTSFLPGFSVDAVGGHTAAAFDPFG